jgi:hypothetical protein
MEQGNFARVALATEHAFTEEGSPERDPVKAADEAIVLPSLHGMCMPSLVQGRVQSQDLVVDPTVGTPRA